MNYLGYRSCLKYLGENSIFMKRFTPVEREFHLPVFKTEEYKDKEERRENDNERLILEQLGKIHDVLKTRQNPDVIVVNTQSVIPESQFIEVSQSEQSINITHHVKSKEDRARPKTPGRDHSPPLPPKREDRIVETEHVEEEEHKNVSISAELENLQFQPSSIVKVPEVVEAVEVAKAVEVPKEVAPESVKSDSESEDPLVVEDTIFIDKWEIKVKYERLHSDSTGTLHIESFRMSPNKKKKQSRIDEIGE
jgi:hypothetical protein